MSSLKEFNYREGFYDMCGILAGLIAGVFDNVMHKGTNNAVQFKFRLKKDKHWVTLTLYSPFNYVKVIQGVSTDGGHTWFYKCLSDHDSCWREDGVRQFVSTWNEYMERLNFDGIRVFDVSEELRKEFVRMSNDRDYSYKEINPY
jgi:hypothetical protein